MGVHMHGFDAETFTVMLLHRDYLGTEEYVQSLINQIKAYQWVNKSDAINWSSLTFFKIRIKEVSGVH